jgi:single-strand DNA-binding protein
VIEFVLDPFSELEILARGKAKPDAKHANEELPMEEAA